MPRLMEWWRAQRAATEIHDQLKKLPSWSQWRIPCDVTKPDDAIVARAVQILLQKHPDRYRVFWSKQSLDILTTPAFEGLVSAPHRELLLKHGLIVPPKADNEGIHSPPVAAGGVAFPHEKTATLEQAAEQGKRLDP